MNPGIYIKFTLTLLSLVGFLLTSSIIQSSVASDQKENIKFKEYQLNDIGIKFLLPQWESKIIENSETKIHIYNPEQQSEINISIEPTYENIESYWMDFYPKFKDLNPNNTLTIQDTFMGEFPSKLLFVYPNESNKPNSCTHHSIYNKNLIIFSYISQSDNCTSSFFVELSKVSAHKL
ncbi:MAG: hypothetical protein ACRCXZ_04975 [Patescibacteria group bacterium]